MLTMTAPQREARCDIQLAPTLESQVDRLGAAMLAGGPELGDRIEHLMVRRDFGNYYSERAAAFRRRSSVQPDDDSFDDELF